MGKILYGRGHDGECGTVAKGVKFRLYPTKEQQEYFRNVFAACNYVYNHFLYVRMDGYMRRCGAHALASTSLGKDDLERIYRERESELSQIEERGVAARDYLLGKLSENDPDAFAAYWQHQRDTVGLPDEVRVPSFYDTCKMLTTFKREVLDAGGRPWLADADATALVYALRNLDAAYKTFFNNVKKNIVVGDEDNPYGFPQFKKFNKVLSKKLGRKAVLYGSFKTAGAGVSFDGDCTHVKLPKIGWVCCKVHKPIDGRIVSATVREEPDGRFYLSVTCDGVELPDVASTGREVAVEVGYEHLAVLSDGAVYDAPRFIDKYSGQLARAQKRLSSKRGAKKGEPWSCNYIRQKKKVHRIEAKAIDARRDYMHKLTAELVSSYDVFYIRDNDYRAMKGKEDPEKRAEPRFVERNRNRSASEKAPGEFVRMLRYKADWAGKTVVLVDGDFPSTQRCSSCGYVNGDLAGKEGLRIRRWTCPECGADHLRDFNSAQNLLEEGRRILYEGGDVEVA